MFKKHFLIEQAEEMTYMEVNVSCCHSNDMIPKGNESLRVSVGEESITK